MSWKTITAILLIGFLFTFPFYQRGYFETHDGEWAIVRLSEMRRELDDFQIPPRWSDYLNHGYGYPLFLFTYPLPYYLGTIFKAIGLSFTNSIKTVFVASTFVSAFGMYFFAKRYWGNFGATVSAILYIIVPYRLVDLYIRGSIGEIVAMAVFPLLLFSTDKFIYKEQKETFFVSLLFAFLILSHNVSSLFFSFLLFAYLIFRANKNIKELFRFAKPFLQGLLLASFFWLPAIFEKKYVYLENLPLADKSLHFASVSDLLFSETTTGVKPPLFIGFVHLLGFLMTIALTLTNKKNKQLKMFLVFNLIAVLISFFFLFSFSAPFWSLPLLTEVDFPWRILVLTAFLLSFISGSIVFLPKGKWLGIGLILLGIIFYYPYVLARNRFIREDNYYETNDATTTSNDELTPVWVFDKPKNRAKQKVNASQAEITNLQYNSKEIEFSTTVSDETAVSINTLYFPGWKFWVDGKEVKIYPSNKTGLINFVITAGVHSVKGKFTRTPIRILADLLTILGLFIIIFANKRYLSRQRR